MRSALSICVIVCVTITQTLGRPGRLGEVRNEFEQHDEGERSAQMQMEYDVLPVPGRVTHGTYQNQGQEEGRKGGYRPFPMTFGQQTSDDYESDNEREPLRYTSSHTSYKQPIKSHYRTPYSNVMHNQYHAEESRITPQYIPAVDAEVSTSGVKGGIKGGIKGGVKGGVKTRPEIEQFDQTNGPETENMFKGPNVESRDSKLKKLKEYLERLGYKHIADADYAKIDETGMYPHGDYLESVHYNTHTKQYEASLDDDVYQQRIRDLKEYLNRKGHKNLPEEVYKNCLQTGVCHFENFTEILRYNPRYRCYEQVFSEDEYNERLRAIKIFLSNNKIDYPGDDICKRVILTNVFQLQGWNEVLVFIPEKRTYITSINDQEYEKRLHSLKDYLSCLGLENLEPTVYDKCIRTGDFEFNNYNEKLRFNTPTGQYEIVLLDYEHRYRMKLLEDFLREYFGLEHLTERDLNQTISTSQFKYGVYSDAVFYNQKEQAYELCVNNENFKLREAALQTFLNERGITILPSDKFNYAIKHGILDVKGRKQKIRYNPKINKYEPVFSPDEYQQRLRELQAFLIPHNLKNIPEDVCKNAIYNGVFNYMGHNYQLNYDTKGSRYVFFVPDEDYQNRVKALNEFYKKRGFVPADHEYNLTIHLGTFVDGDYSAPLVYDQVTKQYKLDIAPQEYQMRCDILRQFLEKRGYKNVPQNVLDDVVNTGIFVNGDQKEKIDFHPESHKFEITLTPDETKKRQQELKKYFDQCGFDDLPQSVYDQTLKNGVFEFGGYTEVLSYDPMGVFSLKLTKEERTKRLILLKKYLQEQGFKDVPEDLYDQILDYGVFSFTVYRENVRFNVATQKFEQYITEHEYMVRSVALDDYLKVHGYNPLPQDSYIKAIKTGDLVLNDNTEKIRYNQKTKKYDLILSDLEFEHRLEALKKFFDERGIVKPEKALYPIVYNRTYEHNGITNKIRFIPATQEYKYNIDIEDYEKRVDAAKTYCRLHDKINPSQMEINKIVYYGLFIKGEEKMYLQFQPLRNIYQLHISKIEYDQREKALKEYLVRRGFPADSITLKDIEYTINTGIYKHEDYVENLKYDIHLQTYEQVMTPEEFDQRLRALQMYVLTRGYQNIPEEVLRACVRTGILMYMSHEEGVYYDNVTGVYIKLKADEVPVYEPQYVPTVAPEIHDQKGDEPKTTSLKPGFYGNGVYYPNGNHQFNHPRQPSTGGYGHRNEHGHTTSSAMPTQSSVQFATQFNMGTHPMEQVDDFGQAQMPTGSYIGQTQVTMPSHSYTGGYQTSAGTTTYTGSSTYAGSSTTYGGSSTTHGGSTQYGSNTPNRGSTISYGSYSGRPRPTQPSNARGDQKMDDVHHMTDYSQEDLGQKFVDFGQETEDLTQQLVNFGQETEDLTQQVQNIDEEFAKFTNTDQQQQQPVFSSHKKLNLPQASMLVDVRSQHDHEQQHEQIEQQPDEPEPTLWTQIQDKTKKLFG